jgi:hypothetical protein
MLPTMAPIALSHGDCAPGAGAEDCITNARRLWRVELGGSPRRRPTRCRASSLPPRSSALTVAGCRLGGYSVGRDRWVGKRAAGGMSEDHDRCFSTLVLGAFSTGVFQHLVVLCSKLKPFPSKLLSKWVQELGDEQRAVAFCVCVCDELEREPLGHLGMSRGDGRFARERKWSS